MEKNTISIVVPAFNEEENVIPFFEALSGVLRGQLDDYEWNILFVDDGSRDATFERITECVKREPRVSALRLSRNFGHQAAITAGLQTATGDVIITMDCDFQDPPEVIPEMVAKWRDGNRIVYARRSMRSDRLFKKMTALLYYRFLHRFSEVKIPRNVGDFRLVDRTVLRNFLRLDEHARYLRGMIAWLGFKHDFVEFERPERTHGETHYSLSRMVHLAMDGVLNFTFLPLRIGMWIGFLSVTFSFLFFLYMLYDSIIKGVEYPLFKWLTVIVFGLMGVQFMFLWILGEYIGRIYDDVRRRPLYVISERLNFADDKPQAG